MSTKFETEVPQAKVKGIGINMKEYPKILVDSSSGRNIELDHTNEADL